MRPPTQNARISPLSSFGSAGDLPLYHPGNPPPSPTIHTPRKNPAPAPAPRGAMALLAAQPPDTSPRTVLLARSSDVAVLVATTGMTHFADAERTSTLLRSAGTDVVAAILLPPVKRAGSNGKGSHR